MTKEELLEELKKANEIKDTEERHGKLDSLLLEFINDEEITNEYDKKDKWYA